MYESIKCMKVLNVVNINNKLKIWFWIIYLLDKYIYWGL